MVAVHALLQFRYLFVIALVHTLDRSSVNESKDKSSFVSSTFLPSSLSL